MIIREKMHLDTVAHLIRLRWLLWPLGIAAALFAWPSFQSRLERLEGFARRNFELLLASGVLLFFVAAVLAKYAQLASLRLSAQDFWLFDDMIRQMMKGGFFFTRFAPQALGMVQHGAVHPYLSFTTILPFAWILGPTAAALIHNPLFLAGAAYFLGRFTRSRWGEFAGLVVAAAFLASSSASKILMYEVHPEAEFPFFVFLWAWAWMREKPRAGWALLAILGCVGVKVDSFLVAFPLLAVATFQNPRSRALWVTWLAAIVAYVGDVSLVHHWTSGGGPTTWDGFPVTIPVGAGVLHGAHWDSPASALEIGKKLYMETGGALGVVGSTARFLISKPWLEILAIAPWVITGWKFWVRLLPLIVTYALLPWVAFLWLYYSAPLLGPFWISAIDRFNAPRRRTVLWIFAAACLVGGNIVEWPIPSRTAAQIRSQAADLTHCLKGRGIVETPLLGEIPRERVWSDRIPKDWTQVQFMLFIPDLGSFETPEPALRELFNKLSHDPQWNRLDRSCSQTIAAPSPGEVVLFVKS